MSEQDMTIKEKATQQMREYQLLTNDLCVAFYEKYGAGEIVHTAVHGFPFRSAVIRKIELDEEGAEELIKEINTKIEQIKQSGEYKNRLAKFNERMPDIDPAEVCVYIEAEWNKDTKEVVLVTGYKLLDEINEVLAEDNTEEPNV